MDSLLATCFMQETTGPSNSQKTETGSCRLTHWVRCLRPFCSNDLKKEGKFFCIYELAMYLVLGGSVSHFHIEELLEL